MSELSSMAESLVGSEIVKLGNEINNRISKGERIFNYTIGDFDPDIFPIPERLEQEIISAYRQHRTNYPAGEGLKELRLAVSRFVSDRLGIDDSLDEILIASGGRPLIYTLFRTVVDPDDKVVYAVPSWNNNHYAHMNHGNHCVVEARAEHNFMPTAAEIEPHIAGAALICLCSPQNPTGTTFSKDELEKICDLILNENRRRRPGEKKLYLLFDQMYWMLTYGETQHYNPVALRPEMKAFCIFVDGISKAFAATGVRVGWGMGPAPVIAKMKAFLSHIGAWAPMAEQTATALFLRDSEAIEGFMENFRKGLFERLQFLYQKFSALRDKGYPIDVITPEAAIYLTVKIDLCGRSFGGRRLDRQKDVTEFLLTEAKLAIVPFSCFGAAEDSPWYRISVGTCRYEELEEMFKSLEEALAGMST